MSSETSQLKTLKDIKHNQISIFDSYSKEGVIEGVCLDLRQEAINWIKKLNIINNMNCNIIDDYCFDCKKIVKCYDNKHDKHFKLEIDWEESSDISGSINWIKHFFNITDEELK